MTSVLVSGIDTGSFSSPSYVAWLQNRTFVLDLYQPSPDRLLPETPFADLAVSAYALDAPQGLAEPGRKRRHADEQAQTPTRVLPRDRNALPEWKLYRGLIEAGLDIFWGIQERGVGCVVGLDCSLPKIPFVMETYPRYVLRRLFPAVRIPSKRKEGAEYARVFWSKLRNLGYRCESVRTPSVDQVDAMLCAIAAESLVSQTGLPAGTVGEPPRLDRPGRVIREGYIVAP
ncbi:MAG: DUF429 domain-containing protein [Gemmatimonadales bacterium]|nr:DUF429 domain-containing protein [Gemmatimonadales bacterium]MYG48136.1 DUF429 domain-containing protein [Gemmatimonadales bacterium]MYK00702.1 DUF429 domain-containing protein [Candidatus Palauibacter ramosifaciens]